MAEVNVPAPGGVFAGATTARGRTPGGRFQGDGVAGVVTQYLSDSILWIGVNPPSADQYVLWINTEDGRWYGKWNDGDSTQWVDLSLPFGEGLPGPQGPQGERGLTGPAGQGIPSGGAANEILVKVDATDYNTSWGARPADGLNILNGSSAPTSGDGVDGEFWIDTTAWEIYGPKSGGAWGSGTSIVGPAGATGAAGPGVAAGGTAGQKLEKIDGTDYNTQWVDVNEPPTGGTTGQALRKVDGTDHNYSWQDDPIDKAESEEIAGTTYTLVAADASKWKYTTNASPVTITVPNATFAADDEVLFEQRAAGLITFVAGSGLTLVSRGTVLDSAGQHAVMGIKFRSSSEAVLFGDIA